MSQRGVAALERGQQEQAEQYLAKAVKACGADPEARRNYAEALWRRGAQVEAIAQFDRALKLDPGNVQLHVRRAEMLLALGQLDAASEAAETAIDLDPKSGAAWAVRGRVAWAGGNARRAMDDLYRALAHTPEDRAVQLDLAEIYRLTGQPHRALQSLQTVTESYSPGEEPPEALHRIGLAYRDLSRHEEAVEALRAARDRGATGADFFTELGLAELAVGRVPEASEAAQQALLLDREHPAAQSLAGKVAAAERQRMLASGAWPRLD
ncbi:MAG: tetratricopeptide repeat protein [Planctomycetota bacterium]